MSVTFYGRKDCCIKVLGYKGSNLLTFTLEGYAAGSVGISVIGDTKSLRASIPTSDLRQLAKAFEAAADLLE